MNYATIKNCDIANGPGVRVSIFVSGCTRHCKDCFNREVWDFQYGAPFTQETIDQILSYLAPDHIRGLTVLGGEPFEPQNQPGVLELLRQVRGQLPGQIHLGFHRIHPGRPHSSQKAGTLAGDRGAAVPD